MRTLAALVIGLVACTAIADEPVTLQSMCGQMAGWTPKQLSQLKDAELEKFLCVAAKANLRATSTGDKSAEKLCTTGLRGLVEEFTRRFPRRDVSEVTGKC